MKFIFIKDDICDVYGFLNVSCALPHFRSHMVINFEPFGLAEKLDLTFMII